jgi:hypothetical protein
MSKKNILWLYLPQALHSAGLFKSLEIEKFMKLTEGRDNSFMAKIMLPSWRN